MAAVHRAKVAILFEKTDDLAGGVSKLNARVDEVDGELKDVCEAAATRDDIKHAIEYSSKHPTADVSELVSELRALKAQLSRPAENKTVAAPKKAKKAKKSMSKQAGIDSNVGQYVFTVNSSEEIGDTVRLGFSLARDGKKPLFLSSHHGGRFKSISWMGTETSFEKFQPIFDSDGLDLMAYADVSIKKKLLKASYDPLKPGDDIFVIGVRGEIVTAKVLNTSADFVVANFAIGKTDPGWSGAPVLRMVNNAPRVVGVHLRGNDDKQGFLPIRRAKDDLLKLDF
jgi:outer membrane murein-binding lipoprotein Lpp